MADLPRGPLTAHLHAIRGLYGEALYAVRLIGGDVDVRLEVMEGHLDAIATFTAPTHGADFPARPDVTMVDGVVALPEGWSSVLISDPPNETVLAGWTTDGRFVAYASTEQITAALVGMLERAYRQIHTPTQAEEPDHG